MMIIHRNVCFGIRNKGRGQEKGEGEGGRKERSRKTKEKSKFPHSGEVPAVALWSLLLLLLAHFPEITLLLFSLKSSMLCLFMLLCSFSCFSFLPSLFCYKRSKIQKRTVMSHIVDLWFLPFLMNSQLYFSVIW